jgi:hypothetical protein
MPVSTALSTSAAPSLGQARRAEAQDAPFAPTAPNRFSSGMALRASQASPTPENSLVVTRAAPEEDDGTYAPPRARAAGPPPGDQAEQSSIAARAQAMQAAQREASASALIG